MSVSLSGVDVLLGGLAGGVTGLIGSYLVAVVSITAKRARNARLVRHGEPGIKDVVFRPLWVLLGIIGLIAGLAWTWHLDGTWVTGAIAGAGAPAVMTFAWLVKLVAQLRR